MGTEEERTVWGDIRGGIKELVSRDFILQESERRAKEWNKWKLIAIWENDAL